MAVVLELEMAVAVADKDIGNMGRTTPKSCGSCSCAIISSNWLYSRRQSICKEIGYCI